jgi:hypothetical protein
MVTASDLQKIERRFVMRQNMPCYDIDIYIPLVATESSLAELITTKIKSAV